MSIAAKLLGKELCKIIQLCIGLQYLAAKECLRYDTLTECLIYHFFEFSISDKTWTIGFCYSSDHADLGSHILERLWHQNMASN